MTELDQFKNVPSYVLDKFEKEYLDSEYSRIIPVKAELESLYSEYESLVKAGDVEGAKAKYAEIVLKREEARVRHEKYDFAGKTQYLKGIPFPPSESSENSQRTLRAEDWLQIGEMLKTFERGLIPVANTMLPGNPGDSRWIAALDETTQFTEEQKYSRWNRPKPSEFVPDPGTDFFADFKYRSGPNPELMGNPTGGKLLPCRMLYAGTVLRKFKMETERNPGTLEDPTEMPSFYGSMSGETPPCPSARTMKFRTRTVDTTDYKYDDVSYSADQFVPVDWSTVRDESESDPGTWQSNSAAFVMELRTSVRDALSAYNSGMYGHFFGPGTSYPELWNEETFEPSAGEEPYSGNRSRMYVSWNGKGETKPMVGGVLSDLAAINLQAYCDVRDATCVSENVFRDITKLYAATDFKYKVPPGYTITIPAGDSVNIFPTDSSTSTRKGTQLDDYSYVTAYAEPTGTPSSYLLEYGPCPTSECGCRYPPITEDVDSNTDGSSTYESGTVCILVNLVSAGFGNTLFVPKKLFIYVCRTYRGSSVATSTWRECVPNGRIIKHYASPSGPQERTSYICGSRICRRRTTRITNRYVAGPYVLECPFVGFYKKSSSSFDMTQVHGGPMLKDDNCLVFSYPITRDFDINAELGPKAETPDIPRESGSHEYEISKSKDCENDSSSGTYVPFAARDILGCVMTFDVTVP